MLDNCWLVNRSFPYDWRAPNAFVASLSSAWSGIRVDIYSDQEAFQMYSCGGQNGSFPLKETQGLNPPAPIKDFGAAVSCPQGKGKGGPGPVVQPPKAGDKNKFPRTVPQYGCVVMEVQDWIDGINHPEWGRLGKQVFAPGGDPYVLQVSHKFSVGK